MMLNVIRWIFQLRTRKYYANTTSGWEYKTNRDIFWDTTELHNLKKSFYLPVLHVINSTKLMSNVSDVNSELIYGETNILCNGVISWSWWGFQEHLSNCSINKLQIYFTGVSYIY